MADTYIVAEIGTGHGGDLAHAEEMIHAAREAGADCTKFQYIIAREIVHPNTGSIDLPGGATPIYERFAELERPLEFYVKLASLCAKHGVDFLCTPFGVESARHLQTLLPTAMKIASPEINHTELLKELATYEIPLIMSTGVSLLGDIEYALTITGRRNVTLLHCVTAYPAPEEEYNLLVIPSLRNVLGVPVGVSDHSEDPALVPGLAVALGATVVEKHFTLSRDGVGLDDRIAMDPTMFTHMAATIRRIDAICSLDGEHGGAKVINEFEKEYGAERIQAVLGDGIKRLSPRESISYRTTRRSLLATGDMPEGHVIRAEDIAPLRAETLAPGIEPRFASEIIGARLANAVPGGGAITWDALLTKPR